MRLIATWTQDQDVSTEMSTSLKLEDGTRMSHCVLWMGKTILR
jgi:hypothetical protein